MFSFSFSLPPSIFDCANSAKRSRPLLLTKLTPTRYTPSSHNHSLSNHLSLLLVSHSPLNLSPSPRRPHTSSLPLSLHPFHFLSLILSLFKQTQQAQAQLLITITNSFNASQPRPCCLASVGSSSHRLLLHSPTFASISSVLPLPDPLSVSPKTTRAATSPLVVTPSPLSNSSSPTTTSFVASTPLRLDADATLLITTLSSTALPAPSP